MSTPLHDHPHFSMSGMAFPTLPREATCSGGGHRSPHCDRFILTIGDNLNSTGISARLHEPRHFRISVMAVTIVWQPVTCRHTALHTGRGGGRGWRGPGPGPGTSASRGDSMTCERRGGGDINRREKKSTRRSSICCPQTFYSLTPPHHPNKAQPLGFPFGGLITKL